MNRNGYLPFELLCVLGMVALGAGLVGFWIYGLYLAFSASVILGVIVLILEPSPFVLGVIGLFNPMVCEKIAKWAGMS